MSALTGTSRGSRTSAPSASTGTSTKDCSCPSSMCCACFFSVPQAARDSEEPRQPRGLDATWCEIMPTSEVRRIQQKRGYDSPRPSRCTWQCASLSASDMTHDSYDVSEAHDSFQVSSGHQITAPWKKNLRGSPSLAHTERSDAGYH